MIVRDFINTIYGGLTQRGATLFISEDTLINYINFGLNDIYSYEGRYWSFMYQSAEQVSIPSDNANTYYTHTTSAPIIRIVNLFDKKLNKSLQDSHLTLKQVCLNIENSGEVFFIPFKNTVTFYDNEHEGYQLDYIGWFNHVDSLDAELPIPDSFTHALYDFTMSYILPVYAQYGENRETNIYQRGMNKLKDLAKADSLQILKVTSNLK